jgi:copper chaperone
MTSQPVTVELVVTDMACSGCAETIRKAVTAVDAAATIAADLETKQLKITTKLAEAAVIGVIEAAGYTIAS